MKVLRAGAGDDAQEVVFFSLHLSFNSLHHAVRAPP
jgi:hypothetical protein